MSRSAGKSYNGGKWTEGRYNSFIRSALRNAWQRWPPKYNKKNLARVERGIYRCEGYNSEAHNVRAKEVQVDHIIPVVDPEKGFVSWNTFIKRLFVEEDKLQVLCKECHSRKTKEERNASKAKSI